MPNLVVFQLDIAKWESGAVRSGAVGRGALGSGVVGSGAMGSGAVRKGAVGSGRQVVLKQASMFTHILLYIFNDDMIPYVMCLDIWYPVT